MCGAERVDQRCTNPNCLQNKIATKLDQLNGKKTKKINALNEEKTQRRKQARENFVKARFKKVNNQDYQSET